MHFEEDEYERNSSVAHTRTTHPPSPKISMFTQVLSNREPLLNKVLDQLPNPTVSQCQMFALVVLSALSLCFLLLYSKYLVISGAAPLDICYGSALFSFAFSIVLLCFRVRTTHFELISVKHEHRSTYVWGSIIGVVGVLILAQSIKIISASIVGTSVLLIVPPASLLSSFK
jgi:hypothetical protein